MSFVVIGQRAAISVFLMSLSLCVTSAVEQKHQEDADSYRTAKKSQLYKHTIQKNRKKELNC